MFKVDLHTHSKASPDGSLIAVDYRYMLENDKLDYIAVTDHNTTTQAFELQKEFGDRIIVGEEISTQQGDLVGLFLSDTIPAGLTLKEAVSHIKAQGGLVYIPHPFETVRKGLSFKDLETIVDEIDIVEGYNGRSLQNRSESALDWAKSHDLPCAASSDAHGRLGWGVTYSTISEAPTVHNLTELLQEADYSINSTGIAGRLYPTINRQRNKRTQKRTRSRTQE